MSANTLQILGTAGGAGNGYWTIPAGSVATLTNANGINFLFETFANYPKLVRLTLSGTSTLGSSAAGVLTLLATIPAAQIPRWALPPVVGNAAGLATNTFGSIALPSALATTALPRISLSNDLANVLFLITATSVTTTAGAATPMNSTILYIAQ